MTTLISLWLLLATASLVVAGPLLTTALALQPAKVCPTIQTFYTTITITSKVFSPANPTTLLTLPSPTPKLNSITAQISASAGASAGASLSASGVPLPVITSLLSDLKGGVPIPTSVVQSVLSQLNNLPISGVAQIVPSVLSELNAGVSIANSVVATLLAEVTGAVLPAVTGAVLPAVTGAVLPAVTGAVLPAVTGAVLPVVTGAVLPVATSVVPGVVAAASSIIANPVNVLNPGAANPINILNPGAAPAASNAPAVPLSATRPVSTPAVGGVVASATAGIGAVVPVGLGGL